LLAFVAQIDVIERRRLDVERRLDLEEGGAFTGRRVAKLMVKIARR
jgi:hypothetical protein